MAGIYNIGSKLGYDLVNGMKPGDSITATDGSVWTKNADGSIAVNQGGQQLVGQITYQPQPATPTMQEQVAGMTGGSGYQSPYADQLNSVLAGLQGSKWEGWNKDTDPSYQAYRKEYLREADRSMEDTLGLYAQNTGGIAGSRAIAAASQAADYHKSQLNDKIPELYDNAYNRHLGEVANQQNMANILMNAESQAQSQYYNQINYALNKWAQMGYADQEVAGILGVTAGTPTSDQSYTDWATAFEREQYDYQVAQAAAAAAEKGNKGSGGDGGGSGNYRVTNEYSDNWVYVPGKGRVLYSRLEDYVNSGEITEEVDKKNGTVTYRWTEWEEKNGSK